MIYTIAFLVLCISIVGFFSVEFITFFKKVFSVPGVALLLPLIALSWMIEVTASWDYWLLYRLQMSYAQIEQSIVNDLPFHLGAVLLTRVVCLFLLAGIPLGAMKLMKKRKGMYLSLSLKYRVANALWVIAAIVFIVTRS